LLDTAVAATGRITAATTVTAAALNISAAAATQIKRH
jgi:hypothetical protein